MEKRIKRSEYYTDDRYGFAIYLISRLYNDLNINQDLLKSLKDKKYSSIRIYLFKITLSHLKEALKLFGKITKSSLYEDFYNDVISNNENKRIIDEISDEFENPEDYPNTINAKYLNVRNDIFHYGLKNKDYKEYRDIQKKMGNESIDVIIRIKNNKYLDEIGVDFPKMSSYFDESNGKEVYDLIIKVTKLCRNILTDYNKKLENKKTRT